MASINLSFKEWPFLSFNQIPQTQQIKPPTIAKNKIEVLKSMVSLDIVSSINFSSIDSIKQYTYTQINNENNVVNNKNQLYHLSSWGRCGLFACTYASCLCIFSNDDKGCLTPIFMFSPFERFMIGKITKKSPKKTLITAIGWSEGHLEPSLPQPYLAVSSEKGHLLIYNISSKEIIGKIRFNEPIITILWSSFKLNTFYTGTSTGHFYICELKGNDIQILKMFDFKALSEISTETVSKSIDFISQDDVNGFTVAISSKDGSIGYITNLNDIKQSKLHVFQNLHFKKFYVTDKKPNVVINFFKFYPNSQDFVTIATNASTFIISISKGILIPFIQTPNCKFISIIDNEKNKVIVGDDNDITVWNLEDSFWFRSDVLKIGEKFGLTEILTFSEVNNKILLTTASNWLTEIGYKRNKLFITKRMKLINGVPIDYDFGNGSIAFLTNNNSISFTQFTPESVIKSSFLIEPKDSSNDSSQMFQIVDDKNIDDDDDDDFDNETVSYKNIEVNNSLGKSSSMNFEIGSDTSKAFTHIFNNKEIMESIKTSDSELPLIRSESDNLMKHAGIKYDGNDLLHGTSNTFAYTFNIPPNSIIKQIEWISPDKLVSWGKKAFYLIDLNTCEVKNPLSKTFDRNCNYISQLFFSKSKRIMCLILNNSEAYLINTESNFEIIKSINFGEIIQNYLECNSLYGSISPKEDQLIFVCKNIIFFSNINDNNILNRIDSSLEFYASFISWKKRGILIGTEKGNAFLLTNKKLVEIRNNSKIRNKDVKVIYDSSRHVKKKLGSIKLITSCVDDGLIILDSNEQGIVISKNIKLIADNIKSFKKCSKETILIRLQNYDKLIALNICGDFSPPPPPYDFTIKSEIEDFLESNQENSIIGQLFQTNELNPSISLRNNVYLLNQIISMHDPFHSLSSKTFLKLGCLEKARNLLLKTNPNDKEYLNNMMIAALYESYTNDSNSVQLVLDNLLSNKIIDLSIDILLINKNVYSAVKTLFELGRHKEAYCILMLNKFKNDSSDLIHLIKEIANVLLSKKEDVIYGLKLLASFRCNKELVDHLTLLLRKKPSIF